MAIYGYTKNYKLIKPQFNTDTWHDYIYDNLDTIDAVMSAIYASGNWKGFWAKNMTYVTGDAIIDQDTDTMYKVMIDHVTSANTFAEEQTAHPDYYELWSPNNLAESWAIKTDGKVSNTDYSAKAYAVSSGLIDDGSAKEWAVGSGAVGNTNEYSAKKYATDAHNDYISLTTNVNIAAVGSNIANVNAVCQSISSVNTVANDISSVNVAAANIEFIKAAEGNANDAKNSKIEAQNSAVTAQLMATQAQDWATKTDGKVDGTNYSSKYYAGQASTSAQAAQDALNDVQGLIATPIGTIFMSIYVDESLDIARRLNGQLISSTKFTGFRSWLNTVQTATPSLFTTETNWQAEKTNSKLGQCGKFVIDDTAGTIRLPCVVNAQGLVDLVLIGGIKSESLPNITGILHANGGGVFNITASSGCFDVGTNFGTKPNFTSGDNVSNYAEFDASRSSSTYQDNAPVQQEAVQYPYYIQVATGIEETLPAIREYNINTPFFFGKSMYSDVAPDNASWLASNGQWNDKTVYPDYYDWLLKIYNGTEVVTGVSVKLSSDTYDDYDWVVNTSDETFRLPLLDGSENLPSDVFETWTLGNSGQIYPITKNGFLCLRGVAAATTDYMYISQCQEAGTIDVKRGISGGTIGVGRGGNVQLYLSKGSYAYVDYSGWTNKVFTFNVAKGNGSLYYYVGDTVQDASLINAGAVLGQLATKTNSVEAAAASMPSNRYIDLTLGASGSTYTAPANGWFDLAKQCAESGQYVQIARGTSWLSDMSLATSFIATGLQEGVMHVPVKKADQIFVRYTATGTTDYFRFIYAEGDKNV